MTCDFSFGCVGWDGAGVGVGSVVGIGDLIGEK